jgi:DNA-binding beta-propeller fold protein YncE
MLAKTLICASAGAAVAAFMICAGSSSRASAITFPAPAYYVSFPSLSGGELAIVDPSTIEIRQLVPFRGIDGNGIHDLLPSPDKPEIYAIVDSGASVDVFDTNTARIDRQIPMRRAITKLAISPTGERLYAYGSGADIFEIANGVISSKITLPSDVAGVTVADGGRTIFASLPALDEIAVIDRDTHRVKRSVFLGSCKFFGGQNPCRAGDLVASTDGRYVIAGCWRNALVLDSITGQVLQEIPIGIGQATVVSVDPYSNTVWLGVIGGWESMTMAPPFTTAFLYHTGGYAVAFQSAGVGAGLLDHDNNFFLDRFTPSGFVRTTKVGPEMPETIVYSP